MSPEYNFCSSTLPAFSFEEVLEIVKQVGFDNLELKVSSDDDHVSLTQLEEQGYLYQKKAHNLGLNIKVFNTYIGINDDESVERLLICAKKMGVSKVRLVLPISAKSNVSKYSNSLATIPAYFSKEDPILLINNLKKKLRQLELKAYKYGIKILLETHWGTIMSSFSSAYTLVNDLNPDCIGITFDPANMIIEGKEDWEFGIKLMHNHLDNVHVKNVKWEPNYQGWNWDWLPAIKGMVDWKELIFLLSKNGYKGDYALEDFTVPQTDKQAAINYLIWLKSEFEDLQDNISPLAFFPKLKAIAS